MTCQLARVLAGLLVATIAGSVSAHWELLDTPVELIRDGQLKSAAEIGAARCGATADLDGDGVLDLVTGHELEMAGAVVVFYGNPDFRQGLRRDLWRAEEGLPPLPAFAPQATVLDVSFPPDFLAIGDFDGDGFPDVAGAGRGLDRLVLLPGDGAGGFAAPVEMRLPGAVTACATGDVNRADTFSDLVITIAVGSGGAVLVYEGPAGALHAAPEWHHLAAPATDVEIGRFDDDPWADIAVAAEEVVVISGRDRRLAEKTAKKQRVGPALVETLELQAAAHDLVFGHFVEDSFQQLAVRRRDGVLEVVRSHAGLLEHQLVGELQPPTTASPGLVAIRSIAGSTDDLVVAENGGMVSAVGIRTAKSGSKSLERRGVVDAQARAVLAARLNRDARDDLVLLGHGNGPKIAKTMPRYVFTVNSTADSDDGSCTAANCTLREALNAINAAPTASGIVMDLSHSSVISPASWLPLIQVSNAVIDGTVGSGPVTNHLTLDGSSCNDCNGLSIVGGLTTVTTISFGGFVQDLSTARSAIEITSDNNLIAGCLIGIDLASNPTPNHRGVVVRNASGNTIGGSTAADRNVISANDAVGVSVSGSVGNNNRVIGNYVGTDRSGAAALGNGGNGVGLSLPGQNFVGTALAGEGNVVSGNGGAGIELWLAAGAASSNNLVLQNLVGVAADGVTPMVNAEAGIRVVNQRNATIGGSGHLPSQRGCRQLRPPCRRRRRRQHGNRHPRKLHQPRQRRRHGPAGVARRYLCHQLGGHRRWYGQRLRQCDRPTEIFRRRGRYEHQPCHGLRCPRERHRH